MIKKLPIFQDDNQTFMLMQSKWAEIINDALSGPETDNVLLNSVSLKVGTNVINHKLGRMLQGWVVTDLSGGASSIYRSAAFSTTTLTLNSSGNCVVNLLVF